METKWVLQNLNSLHKLFHTLGFGHPKGTGGAGGIMKYPPGKPNQADINQVANDSFLPVIILKSDEKK